MSSNIARFTHEQARTDLISSQTLIDLPPSLASTLDLFIIFELIINFLFKQLIDPYNITLMKKTKCDQFRLDNHKNDCNTLIEFARLAMKFSEKIIFSFFLNLATDN